MGRGGAKLGKEVKGAGLLNDADRAALAAGQALPDSADPTAAGQLDDLQDMLDRRQALTNSLKAKAADNADPIAVRQLDVQWRGLMRVHRRAALLAQLGAHRFQVDRRALADDLRRRDLSDAAADLDGLGLRAAQRHQAQVAALVDGAYLGPVTVLARAEDAALARLGGAVDAERHAIAADHAETKRGLDGALVAVGKERAEGDDEATAKLEMEREQIRGANVEAINELRVVLDRIVDDLEQRFDAAHAAYLHGTDERQREFRALFDRDAQLSAEIGKRMARVGAVALDIAAWRKKAARQAVEAGQRNQAVDRERVHVQGQFYDLKLAMARRRDQARQRVKAVAVRTRQVRRALAMQADQAARILALAERARARDGPHGPVPVPDAERRGRPAAPDPLRHLMASLSRAELARQRARQKRDWLRKGRARLVVDAVRSSSFVDVPALLLLSPSLSLFLSLSLSLFVVNASAVLPTAGLAMAAGRPGAGRPMSRSR